MTANLDLVRQALGGVGGFVGLQPHTAPPVDVQREGIARLEAAGWPALWTNEVPGADTLVRSSLWLGATERLVVGTCIANVWVRPAVTAHSAATQLVQAYPGRFVLGVGVGYPGQAEQVGREFGSPVATAREYLTGLAGRTYPALLGANGPKLQAVAADLADGALPAGQPPEATARTREALGQAPLLVVYLPIGADDDIGDISTAVAAHHDAGADHVIVGQSYGTDFGAAVERLTAIAPDLLAAGPGIRPR